MFAACAILTTTVTIAAAADLDKLIGDLSNADEKVSLRAIDDLGKLGAEAKSAVPALAKALSHESKDVRWHAARTLGSIGLEANSAVPALVEALGDDVPEVRAYAAFALGKIGDGTDAVVDRLIDRLFDPNALVRRASVKAMREIAPPDEKVRPIVLKILEEGDPAIVLPALHTLADEGKEAVPRLCKALKHDRACYWACLVLAEIGPDAKAAVPHIKDVLKHEDPVVRLQALVTLGEIGPASEQLVPDIVGVLENDDFDGVRYGAAFALGKIGTNAEATRVLNAAVNDDDAFLRTVSAWALARNNPDDKPMVERAVKLILEAFKSDKAHLRRAAAKMAVDFDVPREVVIPLLVDALKDKEPSVVRSAIVALAELGPKALKDIGEALQDKDLRPFALVLIRHMGPEAASAVPALLDILEKEPQSEDGVLFRREVQFALAAIGPEARAAVPALVKSLSSQDEEIRASASFALGKMGPAARAAVPILRQKLRSESPIERLTSILALLQIQPGERRLAIVAGPMLLKALDNEHELVRAEAAAAVGRLGNLGKRATPRLKQLLNDESPYVRSLAAEALEKLEAE